MSKTNRQGDKVQLRSSSKSRKQQQPDNALVLSAKPTTSQSDQEFDNNAAALPQYATLQCNLTPMVKTKPLVPGHPKAEKASGRIVNGAPASLGQFPHQASIVMDNSYMCGGSLISASVVLTAGHCASGFSTWEVRLGLTSLSIIEPSRVTIVTRSATVHSEYNPNNLYNDIAVVFLGANVPINTYIGLVNLPSRSQAGNSFEGQTATVSGV
ncbi:chymotrypsin-like [Schistocerca americana]|uniref:chymotrypsin-like n=1 Tax=Schistocerca americana TaxID=7009 RepID=UPI001F4FAFCA|nr:chymotrypsin-like [Schistocerca americana]